MNETAKRHNVARKLVLLLMLPLMSAGEMALAQEQDGSKGIPSSFANDLPFYKKKTPQQLLSDLVVLQQLNSELKGNLTLPSIQGWVTSKDATQLLDLIGEETPCLRANNLLSSFAAEGPSTVGVEARRMISGYLHEAYPPVSPTPIKVERMKEMLEQKIAKEEQRAAATFAKPTKPATDKFSQAHRFVFFAVLEGCYEDGLTAETIDLIIPKREDGYRQMTTNFVYTCPLCCPAFDAFHTYSLRPRFGCGKKKIDDDPFNTFGRGLNDQIKQQLAKPGLACRDALQTLIDRWVTARMKRMRFTDKETQSLREQLAAMRKEGEAALKRFQNNGHGEMLRTAYEGWTSCPICSGSSPTGTARRGPVIP